MVFLWQKADFIGSPATVAFTANSTLDVHITDWYKEYSTDAFGREIRHIVRQTTQAANTYWVSQAVLTSGAGSLTLTDFNNNSAAGKGWTEIVLTSTDFDIPDLSGVTWSAVNFTDVESVGWVGEGSKAHAGLFGFDTYSATIPEPATIGILGFGALLAAMTRRLRK